MKRQYRVYTRAGEYHHAYNASLEGALQWAIECAKTIKGSVNEVLETGEEKQVFNSGEKSTCLP